MSGSFGPTAQFDYTAFAGSDDAADCQLPMHCVTRGGWVVKDVAEDDGVGGTHVTAHSFQSGRADARCGFPRPLKKVLEIQELSTDWTRSDIPIPTVNTQGSAPFYPTGSPVEIDATNVYQSNERARRSHEHDVARLHRRRPGPFTTQPTSSSPGPPTTTRLARPPLRRRA